MTLFEIDRVAYDGIWWNDFHTGASSMRATYPLHVFCGMAIASGAIGVMLIGIAVGIELRSGNGSTLLQHPLFGSGTRLISVSVLSGLLSLAALRMQKVEAPLVKQNGGKG